MSEKEAFYCEECKKVKRGEVVEKHRDFYVMKCKKGHLGKLPIEYL